MPRALLVVDVGEDSDDSMGEAVRSFIRDNRRWYDYFLFTLRDGPDTSHPELKEMRKHDVIPFDGVFARKGNEFTKFLVNNLIDDIDLIGDNFFGGIHEYGSYCSTYVPNARIIIDLTGGVDATYDLIKQVTLEEVTGRRT